MAVSVKPLKVGQEAYWLDQLARDHEQYYSGHGEAPGRWVGHLADQTGGEGTPRRRKSGPCSAAKTPSRVRSG